uniref:Uncharacterized protein n=1 Tax=Glossina pallidipes TaxID=7398 RepID=A0A1B0A4C3_GLOPL
MSQDETASYKRCVVSAFNADRTFNAAYAPKANVTNTPYKYAHMGPLVITLEKSSAKDAIHTKITTKQSKSKASYHQSICGAFTSHEKEHEVKQKWLASTRPFNLTFATKNVHSSEKLSSIEETIISENGWNAKRKCQQPKDMLLTYASTYRLSSSPAYIVLSAFILTATTIASGYWFVHLFKCTQQLLTGFRQRYGSYA